MPPAVAYLVPDRARERRAGAGPFGEKILLDMLIDNKQSAATECIYQRQRARQSSVWPVHIRPYNLCMLYFIRTRGVSCARKHEQQEHVPVDALVCIGQDIQLRSVRGDRQPKWFSSVGGADAVRADV